MDVWKFDPEVTKDGPCLTVDAACSGNPGVMEFKGVLIPSKALAFECGPFKNATNNIGEFLAIVVGFRWLYQHSLEIPIYSDSSCAISWVKGDGKCNTSISLSGELQDLVDDAEKYLKTPAARNTMKLLRKWHTEKWGEIPADFGRK
jgi:ribonuclease HI